MSVSQAAPPDLPWTVYVCDNDSATRELVRLWLEDDPAWLWAGGGPGDAECLERIAAVRPSAVLLDVLDLAPGAMAPLIWRIRDRAPESMVLLHSGWPEDELAAHAAASGADGYIGKRDREWLLGKLRTYRRRRERLHHGRASPA